MQQGTVMLKQRSQNTHKYCILFLTLAMPVLERYDAAANALVPSTGMLVCKRYDPTSSSEYSDESEQQLCCTNSLKWFTVHLEDMVSC